MIRPGMALLVVGLVACASRKEAPPSAERPDQSSSATAAVISLERTPCFGACPVYTVAVSALGEVTFQGRANVRQLGNATAEIPKQRVDALLEELDRAGYFTFANRYVMSEPTCGRYATDSPSAITTVTRSGKTKTIVHDYGCGSAPGALVVLEKRIDEVLGSAQWTGRSEK